MEGRKPVDGRPWTDARGGTQDHVGLSADLAQGLESLPEDWLSTVEPVERRVHVGFLALRPVADGRGSQLMAPAVGRLALA